MTDRGLRAWMGIAAAVAGLELRRWRRERVAVACALVLPLVMAALVSLALGDRLGDYSTTFALVDHDRGPAATAFRERVLGDPVVADVVDVREVATEAAARRLLEGGDAGAAVVLPAGLSERIAGPPPGSGGVGAAAVVPGGPSDRMAGVPPGSGGARVTVLRDAGDGIAGDLAALLVDQFEIRAAATALAGRDAVEPWPLEVAVAAPGGGALDAPAHYGPALGLFFVLVTMGFAASRLVADRQRGVVERLAAGPAPGAAVVAGRAVAAVAVGGLSMAVVALAMALLFGSPWGPALPVLAVTLAVVAALAGVGAVLAAVSRTPAQAQSLSVGVAFVFALASGSLAPPGSAVRPAVAELVPTTHALDAYATLTTEGGGAGHVALPLAVLCLTGLAAVAVTALANRRFAP